MPGKVVYSPDIQHRCFTMFPLEAGLFCPVGTRWQCDGCGTTWELIAGKGWAIVSTRDGLQPIATPGGNA